jgi:hypothetical protein
MYPPVFFACVILQLYVTLIRTCGHGHPHVDEIDNFPIQPARRITQVIAAHRYPRCGTAIAPWVQYPRARAKTLRKVSG